MSGCTERASLLPNISLMLTRLAREESRCLASVPLIE